MRLSFRFPPITVVAAEGVFVRQVQNTAMSAMVSPLTLKSGWLSVKQITVGLPHLLP